jgi:hypothetical protein
MSKTSTFARRGPDRISEEIAKVLCKKKPLEFKALFVDVYESLRAKDATSGGEEMIRLRAYEKLQNFVRQGIVKKAGTTYIGDGRALASFLATAAEQNATFAAEKEKRNPTIPPKPAKPAAKAKAVKTAKPAKDAKAAKPKKVTKPAAKAKAVRKKK